tara:strand:- start:95 stop:319 length:225 start_codon:yes stop_codon:yes gene_type:complete
MQNVKFDPLSWSEIAKVITSNEQSQGKNTSITAQGACDLNKRLLLRLREELKDDPLIKEWLLANPTLTMLERYR